MDKVLKHKAVDSFFSLGSLNVRVAKPYKVDLSKRLIGSDNVVIVRVPSLSESLGESFAEVNSLINDAKLEPVNG